MDLWRVVSSVEPASLFHTGIVYIEYKTLCIDKSYAAKQPFILIYSLIIYVHLIFWFVMIEQLNSNANNLLCIRVVLKLYSRSRKFNQKAL